MAHIPFRLFFKVTLVFLGTALLGSALIYLNERAQVLQRQKSAMDVTAMRGHLLREQIDRSMSATYALAAVLRQGQGRIDNFEALAEEMLQLYGGTSALQLAPGGIISRIVPISGNESALGHNLLEDPRRNREAVVAVESRKLTLAGPFPLLQGGTAVVGRLPVFLPDLTGREQFWGFATAMIRIPDLLAASKLDRSSALGYHYELSRVHPDTGQRDVFAASGKGELEDPLSYEIEVPNGVWTLRVSKVGGWHTPPGVIAVEAGIVLLLSFLAALFAYSTFKRPSTLQREVDIQTRGLSRANQELAAEMHKRVLAESSLRERMAEMEVMLGALSDGVIALDRNGLVRYANAAARRLLDHDGELVGSALGQFLSVVEESSGQEIRGLWRSVIREGASIHLRGDTRIRTLAGKVFDARISAVPAPESGDVAMIFVFTDISAEISKERQIEFQAFHDPLTKLGNRMLLARDLGQEIEQADRTGDRIALLCLDLDNFKNINDALGHTVGDLLLEQLAQRLRSAVTAPGWVTRHGGDEFIIVVPRLVDLLSASRLAETVMASIARPFFIEEKELRVTSSIGISIYPDHGASLGELVSNADMAMFEAKRLGRNACCFYEPVQLERSAERLALENGLRVALAENEFSLVFQPKVRIGGGPMASVEALLRWNSKRIGSVSPVKFIPVAEDMGVIGDIGEWVLRQALEASRRLRSQVGRDIAVAVNVSPIQFRSERLIEVLRELAAEEPDLPNLLEIELTEQALAGDIAEITSNLGHIKELGLKIAIDDFGTGYSSLAYLKNFPIDILKIDRAFIQDLHVNPQDKAIVGSVVQLGKSLGFELVAEGVEQQDHVAILAGMGCDYAQGYWFARPLPEQDLIFKLQEWDTAAA